MPLPSITERLGAGDTLYSCWLSQFPSRHIAEALSTEPWDAVAFDMQHGLIDYATMAEGVGMLTMAGKPAIVRVPLADFATASRALDAGAIAVIAPMINTVADAEAFAAAVKFPPVGARSWGPARALRLFGLSDAEYLRTANRQTFAFAMIETRDAIANFDAIVAVPGIDGIFVGPSDLSVTLSDGAEVNTTSPEIERTMRDLVRRAQAAGKVPGAYAFSAERARDFAGWGFRFIAVGSDLSMLRAGSAAMLQTLRG